MQPIKPLIIKKAKSLKFILNLQTFLKKKATSRNRKNKLKPLAKRRGFLNFTLMEKQKVKEQKKKRKTKEEKNDRKTKEQK